MGGKLSQAQRKALEVLSVTVGWRSAYPGLSLGTLNSLSLRKLVRVKYELGSPTLPAINSVEWQITDAGRLALAQSGETHGQ